MPFEFDKPGKVEVKSLVLITGQGHAIDVSGLVPEISIYQDIGVPFLKCNLILDDATSIFNTLEDAGAGFNGQELLYIRYTTRLPQDQKKTDKTHLFILYDIEQRVRKEEKSEVYVIEGISVEGYISLDKKISRAYGRNGSGTTISNMIESITKEFLYNKAAQGVYSTVQKITSNLVVKNNTFEPTESLLRYIATNCGPIELIQRLLRECDNKVGYPMYVFYEDTEGFKLSDFSKFVERDAVDTFWYQPSNYSEGGTRRDLIDLKKIMEYTVVKETNMMQNISGGLFGSRTINIDVLRKNKSEIHYDYGKSSPRFKKLNDRIVVPGNELGGIDSTVAMFTTRAGHDTHDLLKWERHRPYKSPGLAAQSKSYMLHLSNIEMEVTLHGNSDLKVGDKINLILPQATTISEKESTPLDKYLSGYYLITALRHQIKDDTMLSIVACIKDTLGSAPSTSGFKG